MCPAKIRTQLSSRLSLSRKTSVSSISSANPQRDEISVMSLTCATCVRRKLQCDALRPRCSPCRRSHVKCTYDPAPPTFEFRDETQRLVSGSSRSRKRQKTSQKPASCSNSSQDEQTVQAWSEEAPSSMETTFPFLDGNMMPWIDGIFDNYGDQPWDSTSMAPMPGEPDVSPLEDPPASRPDYVALRDAIFSSPVLGDRVSMAAELHQDSPSSTSAVSDHVLAQHYTRNLTSRYSSKNQGWNYHTYFFNRFSSSHPFVMSALYAWTSAHLFCAGVINSADNSLLHYSKCVAGLKHVFNMEVLAKTGLNHDLSWLTADVGDDDHDAIAVALFFLAWTDLILSRPRDLRNLLELEASILEQRRYRGSDSVFIKMATWFCFLDARASAFGSSQDRIIQALGDDQGLLEIVEDSQDFLQKEYDLLYPREEQQRDQAHLPLYIVTGQLVTLLGKISRSCKGATNASESAKTETRASLRRLKQVCISFLK